jgi:hypothetical protein
MQAMLSIWPILDFVNRSMLHAKGVKAIVNPAVKLARLTRITRDIANGVNLTLLKI